MVTFSNPRLRAEFDDWPLGGSRRGRCVFQVEQHPKRGYRVARTTTGKPKFTTYHGPTAIVDGSNGRTYILCRADPYGFITIYRSDFFCAPKDEIGRDHAVFPDKEPDVFRELMALIVAANPTALTV